jgi:hypothetical protein
MIGKYAEECPEEPKMHCIDLVAKDTAKSKGFAELLSTTKAIFELPGSLRRLWRKSTSPVFY